VQDFADQGFALVGGRVDYVSSERVRVLVYRPGQHLIDVFFLPREAASSIATMVRREGYALEPVVLGGQGAVVVADLDASESARLIGFLGAARWTSSPSGRGNAMHHRREGL